MIYEMRTYDLKPHTGDEFEQRFGEAYEYRKRLSPLTAMWRTAIGPLNQVVHVWRYADFAERAAIRAAALQGGNWPPKTSEFIVNQRSEIMMPFAFTPELEPARIGPYFEMCIDILAKSADVRLAQAVWEKELAARTAISPLWAVWYSEFGTLNQLVHVWSYRSLDERSEAHAAVKARGGWPFRAGEAPGYTILKQESKILVPLSCSPVQ